MKGTKTVMKGQGHNGGDYVLLNTHLYTPIKVGHLLALNMVVRPATANELEKSVVHESHLYAKPSDMSGVEKIVIHHTPHEGKPTTCLSG